MSQWRTGRIGDLGTVVTGSTPPKKHQEWFGGDLPFITPTDIAQGDRRAAPQRTISEAGRNGLRRRIVPPGSVCFVCIGATIGKLCLSESEAVTNQQINTVVPGDGVDGTFVYYLLRYEASRIASYAGGAATPILNKSDFSAIDVCVPEFRTQRSIAGVLGAIDDLIEVNRQRVEVLEEMARAIYREWFVHFRYPGHETATFVDSPLGPIPDGWAAATLGSLATEIRRSVKRSVDTAAMPYVPIDSIEPKMITLRSHRSGEEAASSLRLFSKGDVLFGAMRAYFHKVCISPFDGVTRSTCFVLKPDPSRYWYAALTLADAATVEYASAHSSGSTIPYAKWDGVLSRMPAIVPSAEVAGSFAEAVGPLLRLAQSIADQIRPLESLRSILLPKLVTGQIDVSSLDLDSLAEGAVA